MQKFLILSISSAKVTHFRELRPTMSKTYTDDQIMQIYRSGRREDAFNALVEAYKERLYWHLRYYLCSHEDTDDVLQEVFIKIWSALPTFREDSKLYTWVYRIGTNEAINYLRKQKVRGFFMQQSLDQTLERKIDDDPYFNGNELQKELHKAIAKLPKTQKLVFTMRYFEDLPYKEISAILGISEGSLKASYHHAYNKVKEHLEKIF